MSDQLFKQFKKYSRVRPQERQELAGILGLPIASQTVSVPGRGGYVYVRLRNINEIVQAFNDRVAAVYNLPVLLEWSDGRYKITSRDTERYQNWGEGSSFLPEHAHLFEPWLTLQEEGLAVGSGTTLNFVGDSVTVDMVGTVARISISGSAAGADGANKTLSNLDATSINTHLIPSSNMTGTLGAEFLHWKELWIGDVFLKTQTGTATPPFNTSKLWADASGIVHSKKYGGSDNILLSDAPSNGLLYARKDGSWAISSGTSGGGIAGIIGQNEGVVVGTGTILNFVGDNVDVTISGSVMRVFVTGSVGAGNPPITGSVVISDDSAIQGSALILNFGSNLSATISGSIAQIDVTNFPDPPAPVNTDGVIIWNEGVPLGTGSVLNFVGDNVDATMSGTVARIYVSGTTSAVVQVVETQSGSLASGTTLIPFDNTIPQNSEGWEYVTLAITPTNASNYLDIDSNIFVSPSGASNWVIAALFQDAAVDALAVATIHVTTSTGGAMLRLHHRMTAGTTSPTTFKIRMGLRNSGTLTINGQNLVPAFGGTLISSMEISEIRV